MRFATRIATVVTVAVLLGCGTGDDPRVAVDTTEPAAVADARAVLETMAEPGRQGWGARATIPEGGAVLAGSAVNGPGGQHFDPDGVVLDQRGEPQLAFTLPGPTFVMAMIVRGGEALLAGVVCEGGSYENDVGSRNCTPGTVVGHRVDLATGSISDLPLPDAVRAAGRDLASMPVGLYRSGPTSIVLVGWSDGEHRAWRLGDDDHWQPIEPAPTSLPCQVGDRMVVTGHTGGSGSGNMDPTRTETTTPWAQVFDDATGTWGQRVPGPPLEGPMGTYVITKCTASRVVAYPFATKAPTMPIGVFDPATSTWTTRAMPAPDEVPFTLADGALEPLIILGDQTEGQESAPDLAYDPVTGESWRTTLNGDVRSFVPLTASSILVFERDGDISFADLG